MLLSNASKHCGNVAELLTEQSVLIIGILEKVLVHPHLPNSDI